MSDSLSASAAAAAGGAPARTDGRSVVDIAGFWALLETARPRLWLVAAGVLGQAADADDAVQEAALVGVAKFGEFTRGTNFEAWMAQITRLTALNLMRRRDRARGGKHADTHAGTGALTMKPDATRARPELSPALQRALENLDETPRLCVLLRVVGGLSYPSISSILSIPEGTATSHVHRATRTLRAAAMRAGDHADSEGASHG